MAGVKKEAAWWREYRRKKKEREYGSEAKIFELQREAKPQPKSATTVQPEPATVQPVVQPLQTEGCATATSQDTKAKIETFFATNPRKAFATLAIISFVICNTAFLAFEQQKGFVNLGYSLPVAWGIAVLFELAIEILSISGALSKHTLRAFTPELKLKRALSWPVWDHSLEAKGKQELAEIPEPVKN